MLNIPLTLAGFTDNTNNPLYQVKDEKNKLTGIAVEVVDCSLTIFVAHAAVEIGDIVCCGGLE